MNKGAFSIEQLLADDSFLAYVLGTDQEAVRHWESWLLRHPEEAATVAEAATIIRNLVIQPEELAEAEVELEALKLEERLFAPRVPGLHQITPPLPVSTWRTWPWVAASVLVLLLTTLGFWHLRSDPAQMVAYQTAEGEATMVILPDSSVVFLSGNSTLRHLGAWPATDDREVWLEGAAFFHVKPKPRPGGGVKFKVHAANTTVEVLGTRFNVCNRNQTTKVVLSSGKVRLNIREGNAEKNVDMVPGEMVELSAAHPQPLKAKVPLKRFPAQREDKIMFYDTPVHEMALVVEEYYGLKVKLQDKAIGNLKISGMLPTNNEESFFRALAVVLDLEITKQNNREVLFKLSATKTTP